MTAASVAVTVTDDETVSTGVVLSVNPSRLSEGAGATETPSRTGSTDVTADDRGGHVASSATTTFTPHERVDGARPGVTVQTAQDA